LRREMMLSSTPSATLSLIRAAFGNTGRVAA